MAQAGHRTVNRVVGILEFVANRPAGARLADIAQALDAPKSSIHGFLRGLVAEGYVAEGPEKQTYRLGWGAYALLPSQEVSLVEATRTVREELLTVFDETITLAVRVGDAVVYLESLRPSHPVCYSPPLKVRRPLWPTSAGKLFLSHSSDATLQSLFAAAPIESPSVDEICAELSQVRQQGFAFNIGESHTDVAAVAIPLPTSPLSAAISIAGPVARVKEQLPEIGDRAREVLRVLEPLP